MAAVLDAFACKLAGVLAGMAMEEVEMLLGVPGEIRKLETTLGDLSGVLADAERRRIRDDDSSAERWVRELRDVMYDADNIFDLCQIMEQEDPSLSSGRCCWSSTPMVSCFRNPVAAHEIGKMIQALNQRLLDIQQRSSGLGFISQAINSSSYHADKADNSWLHSNRKTGPAILRADIVGEKIEQHTSKLVDILVNINDDSNNVLVVGVTGAGGIGKTTLARMVFNDSRVAQNFDKRIWLSVNKEVNEILSLQSTVAAAGGTFSAGGDKALLEEALKQTVRQNKLLLVMDDVWSDKVWNELLRVPLSYSASGIGVLVTTRNDGVARGMRARHVHQVDKLPPEDAWSLLKKQLCDYVL